MIYFTITRCILIVLLLFKAVSEMRNGFRPMNVKIVH